MQNLTDNELVKKVQKENCSNSIVELSNRHEGLIVSVSKRYAMQANCSGLGIDDLLADKSYLVYKAASQFDDSRGTKFVTWLGNVVRYHCLNTQKKELKYYNSADKVMDYILNDRSEVPDIINNVLVDAKFVLNIANQLKDPRIKKIIDLRYYSLNKKDRSFNSIARKLKMSPHGVTILHNNFIKLAKIKIAAKNNMDVI